ncbi:AAA family ATPase [Rhodococcus sp. APC 3903]|uniref:ATP-dependent nuclease n=1 Tax=Rhodococcus sp. APC 3903 TaxID=3035193 RepID=UPI0025B2F622|nr:AAA family ATPase [Rhodococcus sp. APC 3903]MDN3461060.1 AAA family ATPase [Rhodococcus sp. APC 3903]
MQLASLTVKNFRSCSDTRITFAPDLTVLVGENASGKSAIIDALRLSTFPASGRQTAWFSVEKDLSHLSVAGDPVSLTARYGSLSETEKAVYLAELVDSHDDLIYTASFATSPGVPRRNVLSWAVGESLAEDPEPALRRRISHVYLPPLRDAVRDLDGGDQSQLHDVLKLLLDGDQDAEDGFISTANTALRTIADHDVATASRDSIQGYFSRTVPPNREHVIELNQREPDLRRIARLLRLQLSEHCVPIGDIASTGLGYANLLYISMIVLQLAKAKDSDLTLLLVEEPEAHLHPQLELVLLAFLHDQAKLSGDSTETMRPAGKVQVVVTTHSPVLASTMSIDRLVVVARDSAEAGWSTKTTALSELGLKETDVRKIDRYLNATRAALLFARDVVLVEGIAEMLLLPSLASYHFRNLAMLEVLPTPADNAQESSENADATSDLPKDDIVATELEARQRERQFASATIVSVEGVDFAPYLRLLLDGDHPRVDRVVVVTDRDHTGAGDVRKKDYEELFPDAATAGRLVVEVGGTTLEAEIFRESENEEILQKAFLALRSGSKHHWDKVVDAVAHKTPAERAEIFAQAIGAESAKEEFYLDISKGDFAHLVSESIHANTDGALVVPKYLRRAIEAVAHINADRGPE